MKQKHVVQLLAEGRPQKQVADLLSISPKTVEFHKHQIMETYNLKSSTHLVLFALEWGLTSPDF